MEIPGHLEGLADPAGFHHRARRSHALRKAQLLVHGHEALALLGVIHQPDRLVEVVGNGLLAEQVLARIEQRGRDSALDPREDRDVHHRHVLVAGNLVDRVVDLGYAVAIRHGPGLGLVEIVDPDDLETMRLVRREVREVGDLAGADDRDRHLVALRNPDCDGLSDRGKDVAHEEFAPALAC